MFAVRYQPIKIKPHFFIQGSATTCPVLGLGAFAIYAMARNVREEGNTYYADIAFPAWWLNQNKHIKEGLCDVKAEDICGINYYFKPSKKLLI